jgi:hypothetical protein
MLRIYDRQPGERLELLGDLDPEPGVTAYPPASAKP